MCAYTVYAYYFKTTWYFLFIKRQTTIFLIFKYTKKLKMLYQYILFFFAVKYR